MTIKRRILIVAASPRKNGNSSILASKAAEGVKACGGEADVVAIGNLRIAPCNGCDVCKAKPDTSCVIKDDMQPLYGKIKEADGVIFATPIYWFNVSAQMKSFIDRSYALRGEDSWAFTGKNIGVILTYGDSDVFASGGVNAIRSFQDICAYVKANYLGAVYGTADKPGDVKSDESLLQEAYSLGEKLVKYSTK
jgi:multimeric flavodoxin WrbA